ncbi:MAG: hypothetical protein ACYTFK_13830 [Planctomycetota bacterium]|jgi:hypothetical protein
MELYYKYQPVTWYIGVVEASLKDVAEAIQQKYIPYNQLEGIYQEKKTICQGLASLEPLGPPHSKFLLVETINELTAIFTNTLFDTVALPTWSAAEELSVTGYYVCNVPNTISKDHRTGAYGGRTLEFRKPENPFGTDPTFRIDAINDCGRWCFYRYGDKLPFENEKAYKSRRKKDRFTEEMLTDYCRALGIPVYDPDFYKDNYILVERKLRSKEHGLSYSEAAVKLRIDQKI